MEEDEKKWKKDWVVRRGTGRKRRGGRQIEGENKEGQVGEGEEEEEMEEDEKKRKKDKGELGGEKEQKKGEWRKRWNGKE